jgi:hypothetical protein
LAFWAQTKFDLFILSLSLVSKKIHGVHFAQAHGTNIYTSIALVIGHLIESSPLAEFCQNLLALV